MVMEKEKVMVAVKRSGSAMVPIGRKKKGQ